MRTGGCTVQQPLTPEAATIVKQAVTLARRRGHAQVTPLHVANTMLSSSAGLLRSACLQSHSHPLQCKALELCFNVALNRLPASSSSPMLGGPHHHHHHHHHHPPSLSNALVAAFKRAQAHQRRGSIESQQQPLLAVKIELEQLIISILDDPSVSRVMREAGFSSTQVKANVEQAVSLEIIAPPTTTPTPTPNPNPNTSKEVMMMSSTTKPINTRSSSEDVMSVVESLVSCRKRSVVVVGECLASTEGVVRGVMDRVEKGEVPEVLRSLQFITLPLLSFRGLSREEVEQKVGELRCLVKSCCHVGRGGGAVLLYLGDLRWAAEFRANSFNNVIINGDDQKGIRSSGYNNYCPVEHVIMEVRSLVSCDGGSGGKMRFWVMGVATYQTYMKCRVGNPSLEALLGLHPLTIPAGSLELSLNCTDSESQSLFKSKRSGDGLCLSLLEDGGGNQLTCCADCYIKFESEARGRQSKASSSSHGSLITSTLPSWLQQYKEENKIASSNDHQESLQNLCKKWNSICNSTHKHQLHPSEFTLHFSSVSPTSSSISNSYDQPHSNLHQSHQHWPVTKHQCKEHHLWLPEPIEGGFGNNSRFYLQDQHNGQRSSVLPGTNMNTNSTSSSDTMDMEYISKFKELNAENLKIMCNALEKKVSWQKAIIPEIASTILQCRSGMMRRKERSKLVRGKEDTWLFFQGCDVEGKEKIAGELAGLVFGSYTNFVSVGLSTFSSTKSDSTDDLRNKRLRSEASHSYLERFFEAMRENPHRVFLVEDIEQVDSYSQMGIKRAMERGNLRSSNGEEVSTSDAIIILSCETFDSRSRASSPPVKQKTERDEPKDEEGEKDIGSSVCLDLNLCVADEEMEDCSFDDVGLLESVDRAFFFKFPEEL